MSANLAEFLKVLMIVVSMSTLILSLRNFITNLDTERQSDVEDDAKNKDEEEKLDNVELREKDAA